MSRRYGPLWVAGTAALGALAAVFDLAFWAFKVKIPFPIFPRLKFDLDGIPVILALLMYGTSSSVAVSVILFLVISFRDPLSGFMKGLAEVSTALGMALLYNRGFKGARILSILSGVALRVSVMTLGNFLVLPAASILSAEAVSGILPFIAWFNATAGIISTLGGWLIYIELARRIPLSLGRTQPKPGERGGSE
ncbi:MAG: hypothetical protein QXE79_02865 [Candidatus Bathyarchaeia archaeon]